MNRRTALSRLGAAALGAALPFAALARDGFNPFLAEEDNPLAAPWAAWKAAYLTDDGRVVDSLQKGASHSESQGYGLLLAALFGDDAAFDSIFAWTEANLAIRGDALLAWRWLPQGSQAVPDRNNASDGDLFYAWGLVLRGTRDGAPALIDRAGAIARDLVATCVRPAPDGSGRLLFLPAAQGFVQGDSLVINPSYYMPRAMREVARATGTRDLAVCAADGETLMADLARDGLIPDWIAIGPSGTAIPEGREDRNGYEAIRVPLFLLWSGNTAHPALMRQAQAYRRAENSGQASAGNHVTVFARASGDVIETSRHVGYGAVAGVVDCAVGDRRGSAIARYRTQDQAYYPATLHLMALIAQITAAPECVPL
ncbi:glycosyl hydrolase family 8 [Oceaniglobus trochenteri]|uniref:glycosyl hydrolase family 8 n=1 Tax=Oceaniglobus trochenteri TaxID=2763260 RepID=UPI001D001142|nr:glycosyl hydrolase family 8 [Oceaniglobus trochenteri]